MESNCTPGPWKVTQEGLVRSEANGWAVADCDTDSPMGLIEARANARLIAAAPDLLEACRALMFSIAPDHDYENVEGFFKEALLQGAAAIAKAENS